MALELTASELVRRCLHGESGAWAALIDQYARLVRAVALRHGLSATEVDDVAQEVFLSLAQALHTIDEPERLPAWLMTTTRRLCWRVVQKRRREHPAEGADLSEDDADAGGRPLFPAMPGMDAIADEWHRQEYLARSMRALGDRCRSLITLLFLDSDEPSYDEIAARTGIPKGSIGPTRIRCLEQLRSILEGLGYTQSDA